MSTGEQARDLACRGAVAVDRGDRSHGPGQESQYRHPPRGGTGWRRPGLACPSGRAEWWLAGPAQSALGAPRDGGRASRAAAASEETGLPRR
ncbi:hypothetical protein NDU88_003766 [Pleurodeles waltl]|uniref:Uncharacterized protein n=1 Tax=Pleurodeles waltl TaxID=8319 RepID=A0AAV7WTQ9_PLEWA|nr:hypothetical protein NDU88_003766 [Pleurodeles waltl]